LLRPLDDVSVFNIERDSLVGLRMPMVVNELLRNILDCQAVEALEVLWDALFLQVWWWEQDLLSWVKRGFEYSSSRWSFCKTWWIKF